jgi:hypothetical protein
MKKINKSTIQPKNTILYNKKFEVKDAKVRRLSIDIADKTIWLNQSPILL